MKLLHGDCIDEMAKMDANSVDLTVTSPPYDNLRTYEGTLQWNENIWKQVLEGLYRVTKDGGVVVWVVGDATIKGSETGTSFKQALYAMDCGFNLHDTMVWEKTGSGAMGSPYCYAQNYEFMFVFSKGKIKTTNLIKDRENIVKSGKVKTNGINGGVRSDGSSDSRIIERKPYGKRTNIWRINPAQNSIHPAPFPEQLARDHITSWSNEGDIVFDPFLGSGTTGKVALELGRKFIGVEKVEKYYAIAKGCIEAEQNREPEEPDQKELF
jgi:DNA modification methylase